MSPQRRVASSAGNGPAAPRLAVVSSDPAVPSEVAELQPDEFEVFYDQNIGPLVGALTATLANTSVAQDAAQEAMLRACQRWNKVSSMSNPTGWCYRVGLNWATSRWRKRRREVMSGEPDLTAITNDPNPPDEELLQALLSLSIEHRSVVVLRLWMDWSISDTAAALELPEGTVRSRLSRALDQLRTKLAETNPTPPSARSTSTAGASHSTTPHALAPKGLRDLA